MISSRPPKDSGQHSHERRVRRRFVRNLRSYLLLVFCYFLFFFPLKIISRIVYYYFVFFLQSKSWGKKQKKIRKSYSPLLISVYRIKPTSTYCFIRKVRQGKGKKTKTKNSTGPTPSLGFRAESELLIPFCLIN